MALITRSHLSWMAFFFSLRKMFLFYLPHLTCYANSAAYPDEATDVEVLQINLLNHGHCSLLLFTCNSTQQCIWLTYRCDGEQDCEDLSDEQECPFNTSAKYAADPFQSHSLCKESPIYCGSQMLNLGYKSLYHNTLYLCTSGGQPAQIKACEKKCTVSINNTAFCEATCDTGRTYCGSDLPASYDKNVLYRCEDDSLVAHKVCSGRCITGKAGTSYCVVECVNNRRYCGYELQSIGFAVSGSHNVYWCSNYGIIALNETCKTTCEINQQAECKQWCRPGLMYCGHELREEGFGGGLRFFTTNALYLCMGPQEVRESYLCTGSCNVGNLNSTCAPAGSEVPTCGTLASHLDPLPFRRAKRLAKYALPNANPWMVSVIGPTGKHKCSGVLIHPLWVLTAAHCVKHQVDWIIIGEYRLDAYDRGQLNVSVARVILYPMYKPEATQTTFGASEFF